MTRDQQEPRGSVLPMGATATVRMQDAYRTGIDDLWSAITEPKRLARWIADVAGDLRLGGEFHARFTSGWEGSGRVEECDPPRRLRLTMAPGTAEQTEIEAVLTEDGALTRLVVEERGLPTAEAPDHGAGWQAHFEDLAAHLAGRPAGDWYARWNELRPAYAVPTR